MKKTILFICALIASIGAMAQTDLTTGKAVVPLGGLKTYNNGTADYTISNDNLQKITVANNTDNVYLFPEGGYNTEANKTIGIQGFYIDLGASKSIGSIQSTWEGADCGANIYVTDTEPAGDGSLTGETLIATFTNAQEAAKNVAVSVDNSGRYIVFVPTIATNYDWGVKIRTFIAFSTYEPVLTTFSLTADKKTRIPGQTAILTASAKDQMNNPMATGAVTWESSVPAVGTVVDGVFTALAAGTTTITASAGGKDASIDITVCAAPADIPAVTTTGTVTKIYTSAESAPAYGWDNWGAATKGEGVVINGKNAFMMSDFSYYGSQFTSMDASATTKLHLDVYGLTAGKLTIVPINTGEVEKGTEFTLAVGEWNSLDITMDKIIGTDGVSMTKFFQVKYVGGIAAKGAKGATDGFENGNGNAFIIGNVYLVTEEAAEDTEAPVMTKAVASTIDATSVVLTVSATDNSTGLLTYKVYNGSTEVASNTGLPGEDATIKVTGLTKLTEYTLTVKATDKAGNESTSGLDVNFTTIDQFIPATIATAPTADAANVLAIYSATYSKGINESNPGWGVGGGAPNPLYTTCEEITVSEHKIVHIVGKGFNSRTAGAKAATGYTKAYVALYPKTATSGKVFQDNAYNTGVAFSGLTPGQWNYVEVPVTFTLNYILVALDDETEFYLDHFYLTMPAADVMEVEVTGNMAKVTGPVTAADVATMVTNAGNAAMIDLTGATISEAITLTPDNINAVVLVGGTGRTPNASGANVTANNIVVFDGTYRRAKDGVVITLVDDNDSQPAYDFVIDAQQDGISYSRNSIAADKWISMCSPVPVTIPEGVSVYKATTATTTQLTFEKQATALVGANDPVILHNTNATSVDLTSPAGGGKFDLNLTANPAASSVAESTIQMQGTMRAVTATGNEFALQNGTLKQFENGTKIGAFRVYFTGLIAGATARFLGDDATYVGTIKANGEVEISEVFDLQGRKVAQPKTGLYIVNGKKVVIK